MQPTFFPTPAAFRRWLERRHATSRELVVGFSKKDSGRGGLTYPEALDEALCFGWIDGVRRRRDERSYTIRFTPRRPRSTWSAVNVRHATRLIATGRMRPPGMAAFEARQGHEAVDSTAERPARLSAPLARRFRASRKAWDFFQAQPAGYRRTATFWVMDAKRAETRTRRLASLIASSARGERIPVLAPPAPSRGRHPKAPDPADAPRPSPSPRRPRRQ